MSRAFLTQNSRTLGGNGLGLVSFDVSKIRMILRSSNFLELLFKVFRTSFIFATFGKN